MDINSEILRDILLESVNISEAMLFSELPSYFQITKEEIKELDNKMKQLEEEIAILEKEKSEKEEKIRSSLKNANTTSFHLDIFVKTKNKLESYGIPLEDIDKFIICVQEIKNYSNYNPFKVIGKFLDLNNLRN